MREPSPPDFTGRQETRPADKEREKTTGARARGRPYQPQSAASIVRAKRNPPLRNMCIGSGSHLGACNLRAGEAARLSLRDFALRNGVNVGRGERLASNSPITAANLL
jgi:hypothetical protein